MAPNFASYDTVLKKLRHIRELVMGGRSVDIAARECGWIVEQIQRTAAQLVPDYPEFAWLLGDLEQAEDLVLMQDSEIPATNHKTAAVEGDLWA